MKYDDIENFINEGKYTPTWNPEARRGKGGYTGRPERQLDLDLREYAKSSGITNENALQWIMEQTYDLDGLLEKLEMVGGLINFAHLVREK